MREITSLELHALVDELRPSIENGFLRKFYELGDGSFRFGFYSTESGNTMVYCKLLVTFNKTLLAESAGEASDFSMGIRKRVENTRVTSITQHGSDRIIIMGIVAKGANYNLIIEMFGKGNIVLVNEMGTVEQCYKSIAFRDRKIAPRAKYNFPPSAGIRDIWSADYDDILAEVKKAAAVGKKVMAELSKGIGIGPLYLEDVFNREGVNPKGRIESVKESEGIARGIADTLERMRKPMPVLYTLEGRVLDYAIMPIKKYEQMGATAKRYGTISELLDDLHSEERTLVSNEAGERRLEELKANIKKQEELAKQLGKESDDYQKAGHRIFEMMGEINELISYLGENRRADLEELRKRFPRLKVKELDLKNKVVKIEIGE